MVCDNVQIMVMGGTYVLYVPYHTAPATANFFMNSKYHIVPSCGQARSTQSVLDVAEQSDVFMSALIVYGY